MPRPDYERFATIFNKRPHSDNIVAIMPADSIAKHTFMKVCDLDTVKIENGVKCKQGEELGIDIDVFPLTDFTRTIKDILLHMMQKRNCIKNIK